MKKYCFSCGAKLEFSVKDKPKFCFHCGKPLDPSSHAHHEDEEAGEPKKIVRIPNISGLDIEFDPELYKTKGDSLGSLVGTLEKVSDNKLPDNFPTTSKEEIMKQYKQEAGTLRENKRPEKDAEA
jgi:hypothetical protein